MPTNKSGPHEGFEGTVEGVKGTAKEAAGAVLGNDDLRAEGRKAASLRGAATKEAEAEKARAEADLAELRERTRQQ
ncbi:CsbD family protein [Nocardia sp. NPDC057440]|uniref:microaggregate-binding protein 1 n=1 Tax=Nocardia sp. NPDC057440 TaxID=3346134 RepID=UPI00366B673C